MPTLHLSKTKFFRDLQCQSSKAFNYENPLTSKIAWFLHYLPMVLQSQDSHDKASQLIPSSIANCFNNKSSPLLRVPCYGCPPELLCNEAEVSDLIWGLDPTKAPGLHGISAKILRGTAAAIASAQSYQIIQFISNNRLIHKLMEVSPHCSSSQVWGHCLPL